MSTTHSHFSSRSVFENLVAQLSPEWLVFLEPTLDRNTRWRADAICLHPTEGIVLIESKTWKVLDGARVKYVRSIEADAVGRIEYRRSANSAYRSVEDPYHQLDRYARTLRDAVRKATGFESIPMRGLATFPKTPRAHLEAVFGSSWSDREKLLEIPTSTAPREAFDRNKIALLPAFFARRAGQPATFIWNTGAHDRVASALQNRSWTAATATGPALPEDLVRPEDQGWHASCPECMRSGGLSLARSGGGARVLFCSYCELEHVAERRCASCTEPAFRQAIVHNARPGSGDDAHDTEERWVCSACARISVAA